MKAGKRLKTDTSTLAMPNGRRVGQPGHQVALDYLTDRMAQIGLDCFSGDSYQLPFRGVRDGQLLTNIAGMIPGTSSVERKPILIGAHYDSAIDAPCADDNATAVAVVLGLAESVKLNPLQSDLIVVLFDSEEPPWFLSEDMGSNRFVADYCSDIELAAAFILDLIGHDVIFRRFKASRWIPRIRNLLFVLGLESHPSMIAAVEATEEMKSGLTVFPTLNSYVSDLSDHHAFRLAGQPFLFFTCAQGKYYHKAADDMDWVNMRKVRRVFRYLDALLRSLDRLEGTNPGETDSITLETRWIRKGMGWLFPFFLKQLGLKQLQNRSDMDALVSNLSGIFMGAGS